MNDESAPREELTFDTANLYRETTYTDLRIGTIQMLTPVLPDGMDDPMRTPRFVANTQLMTQMGPLPVQAQIEAANLAEAIEKFPEALNAAVERMVEEAQARQREEASRIVTPGEMMKQQNPMIQPEGGFH